MTNLFECVTTIFLASLLKTTPPKMVGQIKAITVMDPDLELKGRGGGSLDLLAQLAFFPSVISSFFTQNRGGDLGPPGPSPRSATESL